MDLHSNKMGNTSELIKLQSGSVFFFLIALSTFSLFDVQLLTIFQQRFKTHQHQIYIFLEDLIPK